MMMKKFCSFCFEGDDISNYFGMSCVKLSGICDGPVTRQDFFCHVNLFAAEILAKIGVFNVVKC